MEDNPYREPAFTQEPERGLHPGFGAGGSYPSESEIKAFVGKKAEYYLGQWSHTLHHGLPVGGFTWAGFFLSGLWLAYRKMYRVVFIFLGILAAETILEEFLVSAGLVKEESLTAVGRAIALVLSIVCGKFGNAWYLAHTTREIAKIRELGLEGEEYHRALARRGRPSLIAVLAFIGMAFLVGAAIVIASEFLLPEE